MLQAPEDKVALCDQNFAARVQRAVYELLSQGH